MISRSSRHSVHQKRTRHLLRVNVRLVLNRVDLVRDCFHATLRNSPKMTTPVIRFLASWLVAKDLVFLIDRGYPEVHRIQRDSAACRWCFEYVGVVLVFYAPWELTPTTGAPATGLAQPVHHGCLFRPGSCEWIRYQNGSIKGIFFSKIQLREGLNFRFGAPSDLFIRT